MALHQSPIGDEQFQNLKLLKLKGISLIECQKLTSKALESIAPTLEFLYLEEMIESLDLTTLQFKLLKELYIKGWYESEKVFGKIFETCTLKVLDLEWCMLKNQSSLFPFVDLLEKESLRSCYLYTGNSNNNHILNFVKSNSCLEKLSLLGLNNQKITDESLKHISRYLVNVQEINLKEMIGISLEGVQILLVSCKSLKKLKLIFCHSLDKEQVLKLAKDFDVDVTFLAFPEYL